MPVPVPVPVGSVDDQPVPVDGHSKSSCKVGDTIIVKRVRTEKYLLIVISQLKHFIVVAISSCFITVDRYSATYSNHRTIYRLTYENTRVRQYIRSRSRGTVNQPYINRGVFFVFLCRKTKFFRAGDAGFDGEAVKLFALVYEYVSIPNSLYV